MTQPNQHGPNDIWTEERITKLCELWPTTMTATEIAKIVSGMPGASSITKNAVIGKARRMKAFQNKPKKGDPTPPALKLANLRKRRKRRNEVVKERRAVSQPVARVARFRHDMTKSELRAMLTQAVMNTHKGIF